MIDHETMQEVFAIAEQRRAERRRFIKMAGTAAAAVGGASLLAACGSDENIAPPAQGGTADPTPIPSTAGTDADVLNFALSLEYLEANYYLFAASGSGLNSQFTSGTGTQGAVTGGRAVAFADASVASYAREIAADELQHVTFLRNQLGGTAVAQPAINIAGDATGAFTAAARSAGVVGANETFDPYASDLNWLIGGMLLSDVGVTAYKGSATLIANPVILEAAAGILAVEAYHSGLLRTLLYQRGMDTTANAATLRTNLGKISDARDLLDGTTAGNGPPKVYADDDQSPFNATDTTQSNIVPSDSDGIVFGRTAPRVLNIVYLNRTSVTGGGFFPNGLNGNIRTSAAN